MTIKETTDIEKDTGVVAVTTASAAKPSPVLLPPGAGPAPDPPSSSVALPPGATPMTSIRAASAPTSGTPMWQQEKQGSKCCHCCCDFRRAVIIINVISIIFGILGILGGLVSNRVPSNVDLDTPEAEIIWEDYGQDQAIYAIISLLFAFSALIGAIKYNIWMVALNAIWILVNFILACIVSINVAEDLNDIFEAAESGLSYSPIPVIIITALFSFSFLYAHLGFIQEVRTGIMTAETYPREVYSCCCTPKK